MAAGSLATMYACAQGIGMLTIHNMAAAESPRPTAHAPEGVRHGAQSGYTYHSYAP